MSVSLIGETAVRGRVNFHSLEMPASEIYQVHANARIKCHGNFELMIQPFSLIDQMK